MSTILADFKPHHVSLFGEHILHLKHRLAESALFSDAALARLIEKTPHLDWLLLTKRPGHIKHVYPWAKQTTRQRLVGHYHREPALGRPAN